MMITVLGEPVPKGRPRLNKKTGTMYTPATTRAYEEVIAMTAMSLREKFGDSKIKLTVTFYCKRKADTDNLLKAVMDGLTKGAVWDDDVQVVEIYVLRIDAAQNPRTEIAVERYDPPAW